MTTIENVLNFTASDHGTDYSLDMVGVIGELPDVESPAFKTLPVRVSDEGDKFGVETADGARIMEITPANRPAYDRLAQSRLVSAFWPAQE